MLSYLQDKLSTVIVNLYSVEQIWKIVLGKLNINDRTDDLYDPGR